MTFSAEQRAIIAQTKQTNVIVNAVAGSGKTHTVAGICEEWREKDVIVVTYNKRLQLETQSRVANSGAEVVTYHSLAGQIFGCICKDDSAILKKLTTTTKTVECDLLIVDEAQDMTLLLYRLIKRVVAGRIVVLGDPRQCVYEFMGADSRFLTFADNTLSSSPAAAWCRMVLSFTFRFGKQIATFVNGLHHEGQQIATLPTLQDGSCGGVALVKCAQKNPQLPLFVLEAIRKYGVENSMIIAKHTRHNKSVIRLVEALSQAGIQILIEEDGNHLKTKVATKKLLVTTITRSKGLERALVIVLDFDFALEAYQRQKMPQQCPNAYYVATTRAKNQLILVQDTRERPLEFVDFTLCDVINLDKFAPKTSNVARIPDYPKLAVTDLLRYLPSSIENDLFAMLSVKEAVRIRRPTLQLPIASGDEFIADITGTAVPMYYEALKNGKLTFASQIKLGPKEQRAFAQRLLKDAVAGWSKRVGTDYRARQIKTHDWISMAELRECASRIDTVVGSCSSLSSTKPTSVTAEVPIDIDTSRARVIGFADLQISDTDLQTPNSTLIEIKMTNSVSPSHFLQLAAYAVGSTCKRFLLYYVLEDRLFELKKTDNLTSVVEALVEAKLDRPTQATDAAFLELAAKV
jgi:hypothetical protein